MLAASWLACRLPEGPLYGFAELVGELWYRLTPGRAAQARRNFRRVSRALAESGRGSPAVRAAATDPRALERLVRSAYRHAARYYVEVARNPSVTPAFVDERLALDTPELIAEAVVPGKAVLFVGLHFGSVEMAVIFLAFRVGETVTPMETIDDAGLQAYFERTRGVAGIRLVGLREARRELTDALRNPLSYGSNDLFTGSKDPSRAKDPGGSRPLRQRRSPHVGHRQHHSAQGRARGRRDRLPRPCRGGATDRHGRGRLAGHRLRQRGGAPFSFLAVAAILLLFAIGYGKMSSELVNAGGFYAFVVKGLGRPAGLAAGYIATLGYNFFVVGTIGTSGFFMMVLIDFLFGFSLQLVLLGRALDGRRLLMA